MDSRERILKALKKEIPDRVPTFELLIDEVSIIKLAELLFERNEGSENIKTRFGEESMHSLDLHLRIAESLELDSITTYFSTGMENIDENQRILVCEKCCKTLLSSG